MGCATHGCLAHISPDGHWECLRHTLCTLTMQFQPANFPVCLSAVTALLRQPMLMGYEAKPLLIHRRWHYLQKFASKEGISASWADANLLLLLGLDRTKASLTPSQQALFDDTTHPRKSFHGFATHPPRSFQDFQSSTATASTYNQPLASMPAHPMQTAPSKKQSKKRSGEEQVKLHLQPLLLPLPLGTWRSSSLLHGLLLLLPWMCHSDPTPMSPSLSCPLFLSFWSRISLGLQWVTNKVPLLLFFSYFASSCLL